MRPLMVTIAATAGALASGAEAAGREPADPVAGLIFLGAALAGYFLPSLIAGARSHQSSGPIFLLNLFLGWTFVGWVAALVWSSTQVHRDPAAAPSEAGLESSRSSGFLLVRGLARKMLRLAATLLTRRTALRSMPSRGATTCSTTQPATASTATATSSTR